uniref:uncharacterized protein LOC109963902 isoform X2 n=1 Tax=Monopterus albus TaxID=43700 RepID=UPI0009B481D6|nr:uncharacterized protein LOC109963902 isoform X2 [Monopterus albus]
MEHYSLRCQVCCSTFTAVSLLKKHVWSGMHRLKMKEIFQNDTFKPYGFIPSIVIIEGTGKTKQPMLGLSLLTLCFSPGTSTQVYLCHVCEEMCPSNKIVWHLSSGDHYSNYFSYTNPNEMSFSWMPGMKFRAILRSQINKELEERGSGSLQILHLPENLLLKLERSTYAQVMNTLSENDKLLKYLEAGKPKMTMIQTYQRDSNRKHPLVGMQHIVECICTGSPEKRHYLCTLCNLTFAWCMIIKHVLSFDHIHCYFKVWHPSTLVSRESYRDYTNNFVYKIQNLAKQSEEIHGTVNTDMKQVILKPAEFTSVNISSYAEAFEKLKSITKEDKEHLIPNIVPGIQLVLKKPNSIKEENKESSLMTNAAPVITPVTKKPDSIKEENKESSLMTNTIPVITPVTKKPDSIKEENKESSLMKNTIPVITPVTKKPDSIKEENKESSLMKNTTPVITPVTKKPDSIKEENKESSLMKNATPVITPEHTTEDVASLYKLRCQNCSVIFKTLSQYLIHLSNYEHKQMLERVECQNINADKANRANDSNWTGRKPYLYLYAYVKNRAKRNQLVVGAPLVVTCLSSQRAAIYICFACEECFPNSCLALHFESHKHLIKTLLYLNPWRLPFGWENHLDVEGLMSVALEEEKKIEPNQTSLKVFDIPLRIFLSPPFNYQKVMDQLSLCHTFLKSEVPYSKLEQTDRFPLLGNQFLVTHTACDSQLESRQVGYLCLLCRKRLMNSESYAHVFSREHVERFLNCVHPGSLDSSTDTETLLDLAKQAAHIHSISHVQHVELATHIWEPCGYIKAKRIVAAAKRRSGQGPLEPNIKPKMALFPRKTLEQVVKSNVGHNSQNDSRKTESGENKTSQISRDNSETLLKKISVVGAEIANKHSVKSEENAEKDVNKKAPKPSENKLDKERDGTGRERSKSSKDVLTQVKNYMSKDNVTKGPNTMCEKSLEDTHSGGLKQVTTTAKETSGKPSHKTVNNEAPFHVSHQKETDLWQYIKKDDRDPVVGLSSLFECHCGQHDPIYLCECCHLMIPENNIIEHLIGFHHQKMYLVLQNFPLPTWMDKSHEVKCLAASFEKNKGYGEAQVIDMDEENYNIILKQNFDSAIQTVKMLQAQQNSAYELTFNSSLSGVQPVDISATLHTETEACFVMDDIQVVDMVIDNDSEDSKIQPSPVTAAVSVITETTSKTTESTEDVKRTHITVPESRGNADSHLPVFRSSEDASNLHVFRGGANTTSLQPDSTRSNFNDKIAPTTMVEPLKMEMVRPSQTAATSDSPVTTPTESMTPISKYTARSSNCTPDTTKSTAVSELLSPTSSLTTVASSYTLATTKLRENAYKSIETTSGASSTNRLPAANPSSSTTATNAPSTFNSTITNTKLPATAPTYAASASKNKAASTKPTGSTSSTTISNTASATKSASASVLKPQEGSTGAASKYTATSHKAALTSQTGSMAVCEATRRTAPSSKIENNSKNSEMSGKTVTLEANADVAPHVHKSKPPAAPPVTRATPVLSEQKSSPKESSPTSMTKMEPNKGLAIVGRDHVILLHCGKSQQSYCDLCSVRMESSSHLSSVKHCRNFMKMKDPEWTQKESSLAKRVAFWAEVEKARPSRAQEKEVLNRDKYNYLASLQVAAALKIIKELPRYSGQAITSDISGPLDDRESTKSESTGTLVQNPATWQETLENRQQEKSDPELQNTEKTSPVTSFSPEPLFSAALLNTEQQHQSRRHNSEPSLQPSGCRSGHRQHSASQALPRHSLREILQGTRDLSHFSWTDPKPVIGLGSVWECRSSSASTPFYLCECCKEKLPIKDFDKHMISSYHRLIYLEIRNPELVEFWQEQVSEQTKHEILLVVTQMYSKREPLNKVDVQRVMLQPEQYEYIWKAPFSQALAVVKHIKEGRLQVNLPPISTPQQREVSKKTEKRHPEETVMVGGLDGVKRRRVSSPMDMNGVSSKADSVVSLFPDAGTCLSPRGTSGSLSMQTQLRPAVSQCQSLIPKLQVKQAEVHSKSPASSTASPKTTQTPSVSPTDYIDKLLPTRKRPTVTSVKTQVKSCTGNPQLSPPLAKCARSSPQPVSQPSPVSASEFTFVYPTVTSRLLPPEDNNTGQGFDNPMLLGLIDLVKEVKNNIETSTTSANKSSENGVDQRWDSLCVKTEMENGNSECPLLKAIVKQNRPPTKSLEEMVSVAPPVVFKNQHTTPNSNSDLSATNSSVEDFSLKGNILFKATEAKAVGNTLPPASTADPSDLQHQRGVDTQGVLANMNKLKASPISYAANNNIPGQVPQPEGSDSAAVCQLPIKPIITPRPDFTTKKLMGGCKVQDNTCPTRDDQVSHFLPAVGAANPIDTLAARGGYGQYSQMSYVTHGFSGPPAVASYIPTDNPPAYPGSLYGTRGLHSNQICPEQKALELSVPSFGYSLGTPPVPRLVCAQVQHQQPVMQQQQQQQQYSSLRSAALPAGDSNMLNVAPYLSAVSFTSPANNYGLNGYSSNSMAPTQNSSSIRLCSPYITPASFSLLSYNQQ